MGLGGVVVDPLVLGGGAWEQLGRVCGELPELGVVVCTGPSSVAQRVRGLRLGVDDWVTKPCHPEELIARVEAVVRRRRRRGGARGGGAGGGGGGGGGGGVVGWVGWGGSVELARGEFELIALLVSVEGRVLEREEIYQRVWGYAMARGDRSVDVFVRKLRQKL